MATTTNYGWTTPDDTALVKDGAAAIRSLGTSIDTTTKNLNPETTLGDLVYRSATANVKTRLGIGSTGQVLTVSGGVPVWSTPSDQTPLTTKGDLFTFDTADARLAVGTNGQYLSADSTTATGLKWATPASGAISSWTLLNTGGTALTGATKVTVSFSAQKQLLIVVAGGSSASVADLFVRLNDDSTTNYSAGNLGIRVTTNTTNFAADSGGGANYFGNERISIGRMGNNAAATVGSILKVESADSTGWKYYSWMGGGSNEGLYDNAYIYSGQGIYRNSTSITSVSINSSTGNLDAGTVYVLGGN